MLNLIYKYEIYVRVVAYLTQRWYWSWKTLQWRHNERLKSPASRLFTQPFIQAQIKENTKAPRHWPLCGEFIGLNLTPWDRWIPRTNGQ